MQFSLAKIVSYPMASSILLEAFTNVVIVPIYRFSVLDNFGVATMLCATDAREP